MAFQVNELKSRGAPGKFIRTLAAQGTLGAPEPTRTQRSLLAGTGFGQEGQQPMLGMAVTP